jgi:PmbA protein
MNRDLLEEAKNVVKSAQNRGAQGVRASIGRTRSSRIEWRDGKLDRLRESTQMSLGITLFVEGRFSSNSTSDLRPEAVGKFLDEIIATTKVLAKDPHRKLPDPKRYEGRFEGDLRIFDQAGSRTITAVDRRRIVQALEEAARSAPGNDRLISVKTTCSDSLNESAMVNSNGMEGSIKSSSFVIIAETSARDEGDRKPEGWWYAVSRYRNKLPSVESVGKEATRRAVIALGAKPEPSGEYPCVIENVVVGTLLQQLSAPLSGSAIQQRRSFLADKLGKQIGSERLTIIDDPHVIEGLGSRIYDGEGMTSVRRPIVDKGVLKSFLLDTYYASKLDMEPTTSGVSNVIFSYGDKDLDGLLKAMDKGILITGFSGGNSNSATGDFSIGIRGLWIENGKPSRPIAEMNLAGNHLNFWNKLVELGSDAFLSSSVRCPSLRFDKVQFSGV